MFRFLACLVFWAGCNLVGPVASALAQWQTDRVKLGLVGPVSTVVEKQKPAESSTGLEITRRFNSHGDLLEVTTKAVLEKYPDSQLKGLKTVFTYDGAGKKVGGVSFRLDGTVHQKTIYGCDVNGFMEMEATYGADESFVLLKIVKQDTSTQRTETLVFTPHPPYFSKMISEYDRKANTTIVWQEPHGSKTLSLHDSAGRIAEDRTYQEEGGLIVSATYKYDNHGNPVEQVTYRDRLLKEQILNVYKYDATGNWTETITDWVLKDGEPSAERTLISRDISYFSEKQGNAQNN